jgi:hypothetical protein
LPTVIPWALRYSRVVVEFVIFHPFSDELFMYILSDIHEIVNTLRKLFFRPTSHTQANLIFI